MDFSTYFKMIYTVSGGLGVFFLGLRFLSDGLQSLSGNLIRRMIGFVTANRLVAVLAGFGVTTLVQSSSVTTVMVVGLVNAGLMELRQAIGVILGANIGTTITGWILVIKIGKYGLLLIGLGIFPMLFSKRSKISSMGKTLVALGLIFLGLELMSGAFKPLRSSKEFISYLALFDTGHIFGLLGSVGIGCLLTFVIQSSSAMLGITISLAVTGAIDYPTAAALVLGENIGTTITALVASVDANTEARRAAVSHAIFNVVGVLLVILCFKQYIALVDMIVPGNPEVIAADGSKPLIASHIAMGHTLFNVSATLVMLPFLGFFAHIVEGLVPDKSKARHHLRYLGTPGFDNSGISLNMAELELRNLALITRRSLRLSMRYVRQLQPEAKLLTTVKKLEEITDNIQKEITSFVCHIMEGELGPDQSAKAYTLIRAADELESIADYTASLCHYKERLMKQNQQFSDQGFEDLENYLLQTGRFCSTVLKLCLEGQCRNRDEIVKKAATLNLQAVKVRDAHLQRMGDGLCEPVPALVFSDMIVALRRIKNHTFNLFQALDYVPGS